MLRSTYWYSILITTVLAAPLGCSNVKFQAVPSKECQQFQRDFGASACTITPNGYSFNYSLQVGMVDLLFVDDNSGSMYSEQVHMADRFPGFLDSIYRLDYRLAIITTDVTNGNGGKFLKFPNGSTSIGNSSRAMDAKHYDNINQFQNTIKRPETLTCDSSGYTNCPSGDERGIYALNLAIERSEQRSFFRSGGHLAVIILSDEDERSNGGNISGYPLESLDLPLTFATRSKQFLGSTKSVSVHSIIIRPGDQNCYNIQNNQGAGIRGYVGYQYAALSQPSTEVKAAGNLVQGVLGDICSSNYTNELGNIAAQINQNTSQIQLPCRPIDDKVEVTFNPAPNQQIYYSIDSSNRLNLNPAAVAGTRVTLKYQCKP